MKNQTKKNLPNSDELHLKIDTTELFKPKNEIIIIHRGEDYRLRITSNDKLILTK